MKKISKILFALTLIFILNINVKAVTITTDNTKQGTTDTNSYLVTNKGNITINNVGTDTFKGYKILDYYYNSTSNSLSYEFTDDFKTFLETTTDYKSLTVTEYRNLTSGDTTNGSTQTTSTLDTLMSQYANYIYTHNTVTSNNLTTSNSIGIGNFNIGSYLVLPNSSVNVYAVMVGNIDLEYKNNTWSVVDQTINAKVSTSTITNTIVGSEIVNNKTYVSIGNDYTYKMTINVPKFPTNATNKWIEIHNYLSNEEKSQKGLEFVDTISDIIIKDGNTNLTLSKINDGEGKILKNSNEVGDVYFTGDWDDSYLGLGSASMPPTVYFYINTENISADTITIEYKIKLNNNAIIGSTGNDLLTTYCTTEAYDEEFSGNCTGPNLTTTLYSYGIKINTKDNANNNLNGAGYKLYSDATLNTEVGSFTTNESISTITGLAPGTYYVKQVTAPNGSSNVNNETFTVNLEESQDGYLELNVTNTTGLLPVTGGIGTLLFGIVGLLVIIGAFAYYKVNQKKKLNSAV